MSRDSVSLCGPVLIWSPEGRDASVIADVLNHAGVEASVSIDGADFFTRLNDAGAAVIAREVLTSGVVSAMSNWISRQPGWSDFPLIVLTDGPEPGGPPSDGATPLFDSGNVTLLERPCFSQTLVSTARSALRARQRQLQLADELKQRQRTQEALQAVEHRFRAELEELVRVRTEALVAETADRERAQDALRQAQKMEAIGQLTGGLAHDFNNLLQGVAGNLELIKRFPGDPAKVEGWAQNASHVVERGSRLTAQLLAFSRHQEVVLAAVPVSSLVRGLADLFARTLGSSIDVKLDLCADDVAAAADPTQLELAVLNLAINARDAMNGSGTLTIATSSRVVRGEADIADGSYVQIDVSDTGAGMSPEVAARAFEPFFTTKPAGSGTGLGLAQVYGICRQAQGTARISSQTGRGTTVLLLLRRVRFGEGIEPEAHASGN